MRNNPRSGRTSQQVLVVLAAMLVIVGLVLASTAPAGPSSSNKVDAYGGSTPVKPTNPKTKAECDSYYQATNQLADARDCRAIASYNVAIKRCAKKKGAKQAACKKAAKASFKKAKAKVAKQRKAEAVCAAAANAAFNAVDFNAPDAQEQYDAINAKSKTCYEKAQSGG